MSSTVCWCGSTNFEIFSDEYWQCSICRTLKSKTLLEDDLPRLSDDSKGFYGRDYWLKYQTANFDYPDIHQRSRSDTKERALYWLRNLMKYRLPPAASLELGCGSGSLVYLMKLAGYQARGAELSEWVCEYLRKTFDVPISVGRLEDIDLTDGELDIAIMMDVLEHVSDPLETLKALGKKLKGDGILVVQTPLLRDVSMGYNEMLESKDVFLKQLKPKEHVYLFNEASIREALGRSGFLFVEFLPALFPYDMFFVASKEELKERTLAEITQYLEQRPDARAVLALLDLYDDHHDLVVANETSKAKLDADGARIAELERRCSEEDRLLLESRSECYEEQAEIGQLRKTIEGMLGSRSWRATRPLRFAARLAKRTIRFWLPYALVGKINEKRGRSSV